VPLASVRIPLPLASVVNVATGAPVDDVIVPLTVTAPFEAVELVTTRLFPPASVPERLTATSLPSASNVTLPLSADEPSCVPPEIVNGGALESVSPPSAPLNDVPLRVPANVVSLDESVETVAFTAAWCPYDALIDGFASLAMRPVDAVYALALSEAAWPYCVIGVADVPG
jgi:hypothetical protein